MDHWISGVKTLFFQLQKCFDRAVWFFRCSWEKENLGLAWFNSPFCRLAIINVGKYFFNRKTYIGISSTKWKSRYANHKFSMVRIEKVEYFKIHLVSPPASVEGLYIYIYICRAKIQAFISEWWNCGIVLPPMDIHHTPWFHQTIPNMFNLNLCLVNIR